MKGNKLTDEKRMILKEAREYCDNEDKSTEFMIRYMMDKANLSMDTVLDFLKEGMQEVIE